MSLELRWHLSNKELYKYNTYLFGVQSSVPIMWVIRKFRHSAPFSSLVPSRYMITTAKISESKQTLGNMTDWVDLTQKQKQKQKNHQCYSNQICNCSGNLADTASIQSRLSICRQQYNNPQLLPLSNNL